MKINFELVGVLVMIALATSLNDCGETNAKHFCLFLSTVIAGVFLRGAVDAIFK